MIRLFFGLSILVVRLIFSPSVLRVSADNRDKKKANHDFYVRDFIARLKALTA